MESSPPGLRAAAEPTRLRLLLLCAEGELTVSELTDILGQSQPRVSRHLKLLCDAGLLDRFREGNLGVLPPGARGRRRRAGAAPGRRWCRPTIRRGARPRAAGRGEAPARRRGRRLFPRQCRRNGTRSARSISTSARSRRRCSTLLPADGDRATCSISAPAPAACSRLFGAAGRARGRRRSLARDAGGGARQSRARAVCAIARSARATCTSCRCPSESFDAVVFHQVLHYAERPAPGDRRGGARAAAGRPAGDRRFRAARAGVPARRSMRIAAWASPMRRCSQWCAEAGLDARPIAASARRAADRVAVAGASAVPQRRVARRRAATSRIRSLMSSRASLLAADPCAPGRRRWSPSNSSRPRPPRWSRSSGRR